MKRATQLALTCVVAGWAVAARADAVGDYKVILERNPFGLKAPPPPPPPPTNAPVETPTSYKLTGITALFKPARAMFVNDATPNKPEYLSLSEGQRQGNLEILPGGIDLKAGAVRVKISGTEQTLSFAKNGLKATAQPVMTAPGMPTPLPGMNPVPAMPGGTVVMPQGGSTPQFNRPTTVPTTMPSGVPAPTAIPAPVIQAPGQPAAPPSRQIRTVNIPLTGVGNQTTPPPAPNVDPVVQTVAIEVQRAATREQVAAGQLPPLPPTDLTGR